MRKGIEYRNQFFYHLANRYCLGHDGNLSRLIQRHLQRIVHNLQQFSPAREHLLNKLGIEHIFALLPQEQI